MSLPLIFKDAVSAYIEAQARWREGSYSGAAALAYSALDTATVYLERLGVLDLRGLDGQAKHDARRKYAATLVSGIDLETLESHWVTRQVDLYYGSGKARFDREPVRPSAEHVCALFGDIQKLLLAIADRFLSQGEQRTLLAQFKAADDHPTVMERLLATIEEPIIVGAYDSVASRHLDQLVFEIFKAKIPTDDFYRGWIALLAAHRAMHQGEYRKGVRFATIGLEAYRNIRAPYRVHHLHKIKAACFRERGMLRDAAAALKQAFESAGSDREFVNALAIEQAVQYVAVNAGDEALMKAIQSYDQALDVGDPVMIARRKVTARSVMADTGNIARACELGDDWAFWFNSDNVIARAYFLECELKLAFRLGALDRAHEHARVLTALALPRGLKRHLKIIQATLPDFSFTSTVYSR